MHTSLRELASFLQYSLETNVSQWHMYPVEASVPIWDRNKYVCLV